MAIVISQAPTQSQLRLQVVRPGLWTVMDAYTNRREFFPTRVAGFRRKQKPLRNTEERKE